MKRWIIVVVSLLLYATPVGAVTITSGTIGAFVGTEMAPIISLQGTDGYAFESRELQASYFYLWGYTATPGSTVDISGTDHFHTFTAAPSDGVFTFTVAPIYWQDGSTAPFTMLATLNGVALDGGGTFKLVDIDHAGSAYSVLYTFEASSNGLAPVPEPATLFLVGTGLVAAGVWHRRRRR